MHTLIYYYVHTMVLPTILNTVIGEMQPENVAPDQQSLFRPLMRRDLCIRVWVSLFRTPESVIAPDGTNILLSILSISIGVA